MMIQSTTNIEVADPAPASPAPGRIGRNPAPASPAPGRIGRNHLAFGISTSVESPLQISSFMQNKANFSDNQINVTKVLTRDYENKTLGGSGKNKANSKPNKANSKPNKANSKPNKANLLNAQINVNKVITKDYEKISNWAICENKANIKPKQTQTKPILTPAQVNIIRCDLRVSQSVNMSIIIEGVRLLLQNNGVPESKGRF